MLHSVFYTFLFMLNDALHHGHYNIKITIIIHICEYGFHYIERSLQASEGRFKGFG